jgi:hypothetical protein
MAAKAVDDALNYFFYNKIYGTNKFMVLVDGEDDLIRSVMPCVWCIQTVIVAEFDQDDILRLRLIFPQETHISNAKVVCEEICHRLDQRKTEITNVCSCVSIEVERVGCYADFQRTAKTEPMENTISFLFDWVIMHNFSTALYGSVNPTIRLEIYDNKNVETFLETVCTHTSHKVSSLIDQIMQIPDMNENCQIKKISSGGYVFNKDDDVYDLLSIPSFIKVKAYLNTSIQ